MLEKEVTRAGYAKYHAPDSGHDDAVDALALAYKGLGNVATDASATATLGGDDRGDGPLFGVAREMDRRRRGNKWK